jgi:cell surface protein SprA
LGVKNISFSYSQNRGTLLPGFLLQPKLLGQDWSSMAPSLPFVFGSQKDIRNLAGSSGWITQDTSLNSQYKQNSSTNLTFRSTIEPIKQFRIELNASKNTSSNNQEYFRWDNINNGFNSFSATETGSYSISFISFPTAFVGNNDDYSSSTFAKFRGYRADIANRLASENPNFNGVISSETGFPIEYSIVNGDTVITGGYGPTSQEVMIPAFLAAYGGQSSIDVSLNQMPKIPLPNWRITYDGLIKIKAIKRYFKTFSLAHSYRSTYSVSSYNTNLNYIDGDEMNLNNLSYHVQKEIAQVSINEQFSPLFKLDMLWKNSLITKIEIKNSRMLSLSLINNQLTETNTKDYVIGTGFRIKDLEFRFMSGGRGKKMSSDLDLKLDLNIRNNKTIIRKVIEDVEQITMGQQIISIKFSADYVLNQRLNIKAFYDKVITNPFISTTFPGSITNAGFSLRFTLAG